MSKIKQANSDRATMIGEFIGTVIIWIARRIKRVQRSLQ